MLLHELTRFEGERSKPKRVGRGPGSGLGKTSGKGHKGQNARAGGGVRPGFEGGQMPLQRRLPKRGFNNSIFAVRYDVINLDRLVAAFDGKNSITLDDIYDRGLCPKGNLVKILGNGSIDVAVTIEAHRFSSSAVEKIQKAGGQAKALEG